MTACVDPRGVDGIRRGDPAVRLRDYARALQFWVDLPDERLSHVIVVENSGYDLEPLRELAARRAVRSRRVEFWNLSDNSMPAGVSYGYPELGMLDEASTKIAAWGEAPLIAKVTGRLTFPDLPRLIDRFPADAQFMGDARSRHRPSRRTGENGTLTTQLMLFTPEFYRCGRSRAIG
jgi:hypothetical protein